MNKLTCANLVAKGRHIPVPFCVKVVEGDGEREIKIDTLLRVVPGKRLIGISSWKDSAVIIKLFFHTRYWKRDFFRDVRGINLLLQYHIPTPKILNQTTTSDGRGGVLVIDYLQQGVSLGSLFEEAHYEEARCDDVMKRVLAVIGDCHRSGIWQKDMHLHNFMLVDKGVYLLDGGDIQAVDGGLKLDSALDNLAVFFAQFPVSRDARIGEWLEYYQQKGLKLTPRATIGMNERIRGARKRRIAHFEKKLFRSTTANRCIRTSNRFVVYDRAIHSSKLESFIENPDEFINEENLIKAGNTSTVGEIRIGDREFILKRYNIKSFWHGLTRLFKASRAQHSWRNAWVLEMLGIATPHPCLMLEERLLWLFRRKAFFLTEKVPAPNIFQCLKTGGELEVDIDSLVEAFQELFDALNDYQISHGDMKATNFIFNDQKLYVLDLDAMHRHKLKSKFIDAQAKDMSRFQRNWQDGKLEPNFGLLSIQDE